MGPCFCGKILGDLFGDFSTFWNLVGLWTTSESKSCFCRAFAEPNRNLTRHGRSTTSELGLILNRTKTCQKSLITEDWPVGYSQRRSWTQDHRKPVLRLTARKRIRTRAPSARTFQFVWPIQQHALFFVNDLPEARLQMGVPVTLEPSTSLPYSSTHQQ